VTEYHGSKEKMDGKGQLMNDYFDFMSSKFFAID
jgi:hypothetical protein